MDDAVVVLIDEGGELYLPQRDFDALPTVTQSAGTSPDHLVALPASLTSRLVGEKAHIGDAWTIDVPQIGRFHATVERFVLGYRNCGEAWGVLLKLVAADRARFHAKDAPVVIARPGTIEALAGRTVGSMTRSLSTAERTRLSQLLEQARLDTIGEVRSATRTLRRSATPEERALIAKWTALDKALDRKGGRLAFDVTLYRLTPDDDPRAFVRARWIANGTVAYALAAWVRLGSYPAIEDVDASPARLMRFGEEGVADWDVAIPKVLGVFDVNADGRAEVLVRHVGYENVGHVLIEYSSVPGEKPRELSAYGDGC